jgi:hypothetical protein
MSNLAELQGTIARLQAKATAVDELYRSIVTGSGGIVRAHPDAEQATTRQLDNILAVRKRTNVRRSIFNITCIFEVI